LSASTSAADVHGRPDLKNPSGAPAAAVDAAAVLNAAAAAAFEAPALQQRQSQQEHEIRLSQFDGGFFRPVVDHVNLPRAVLTFDGAYEQIEAVLSSDIAEWCVEHNIGLFKWAAACSLVQQPNDVSRCHRILHRLFASSKYLYAPVKKENIKTCMLPVIAMLNSLPKLAKDSKMTFTKFFCNLHDILHDAFRPDVVRRGWEDAGIYPFDVERIMSGWNHGATQVNKSWEKLEPEYKRFCLIAIGKLRVLARSGQLLDDVIENVIVREEGEVPGLPALTLLEAMTLAEAGDPEYMKVQITGVMQLLCLKPSACLIDLRVGKTAINHNRCLHLTAAEFLGRVRAANARQEDFDAVVEEFGQGCPCKHPPLKSKGKQHLGTTAHKNAFEERDGRFYGMTVRQALEHARSNNVILLAGSAQLEEINADNSAPDIVAQRPEAEEFDEYSPADADAAAEQEDFQDRMHEALTRQDEDVTGIVVNEE
jgi:hypothetical protein